MPPKAENTMQAIGDSAKNGETQEQWKTIGEQWKKQCGAMRRSLFFGPPVATMAPVWLRSAHGSRGPARGIKTKNASRASREAQFDNSHLCQ
jgi:hypothetical protein